jgi:hypothetical protein
MEVAIAKRGAPGDDVSESFRGEKGGASGDAPPATTTSEGQNFDLAKYIVSSTRYEYSIQYIASYNAIHCF